MKISRINLKNFRRLENIEIGFEDTETVFVGPNNSGKTSATVAFKLFLARPDFKIHDFSASKISEFDLFGASDDQEPTVLPSIEFDLWFSIDPEVEFGRVFSILPNVTTDLAEVGIRISYSLKDPDALKLRTDYLSAFPRKADGKSQKSLSHFLALEGNLSRHFGLNYFALEKLLAEIVPLPIEPEEGKHVIKSLLRVDFVDAQRNIDDQELGRSNRLSSAFSAFYKSNLEQAEASEKANQVIDENNDNLTVHYKTHFSGLMSVIQSLGVPSVNDRVLEIVSSLSPESALKGNTDLLYFDTNLNHRLPEAYNGLGFKNLVYMAIQVSHFHLQWMNTDEKQPLCHIIFIEEPEVHLHAQVQQTFISNIWAIVRKTAEDANKIGMLPQLVITTHSSHILDTVEFCKVRYFHRCQLAGEDPNIVKILNASNVRNLRDFRPDKKSAAGDVEDEKVTLEFLKRYLKLTHCDLFFADAAILVEGSAEKLLMPDMIEKTAPSLRQKYLTVLEIGGAYAHRFASFLEFLGIPYLVITDIDSVDPANKRKACRADMPGAVTSNASLKFFFDKKLIQDLVELEPEKQVLFNGVCLVAFQRPTDVAGFTTANSMHGRTFEEALIYEKLELFRDKKIDIEIDLPTGDSYEGVHQSIFEHVKSDSFKKTEFALDVASSAESWNSPKYIADALLWLEKRLTPTVVEIAP
jgi:putative ATP-dependent endonuclease of the OLD family